MNEMVDWGTPVSGSQKLAKLEQDHINMSKKIAEEEEKNESFKEDITTQQSDFTKQIINRQSNFEKDLNEDFKEYKDSTDNYIDSSIREDIENLDLQEEVNTKVDDLVSDGTINNIVSPLIPKEVTSWLEKNINDTSPPIDKTLSIENTAADAKVTGLKINTLEELTYKQNNTISEFCGITNAYFRKGSINNSGEIIDADATCISNIIEEKQYFNVVIPTNYVCSATWLDETNRIIVSSNEFSSFHSYVKPNNELVKKVVFRLTRTDKLSLNDNDITNINKTEIYYENNIYNQLKINVQESDFLNSNLSLNFSKNDISNSGELISSNITICSDFILLAEKNLYIAIPSDYSVSVKIAYYDINKNYVTQGGYQTVSRIISDINRPYVRIILKYTDNSNSTDLLEHLIKASIKSDKNDNYHGNIKNLGYTSFANCNKSGYYSFKLLDLETISDKPERLRFGGILIVYTHFASGQILQILQASNGDIFFRYGSNAFTHIFLSDSINSIFPTWEIGAINSSTGIDAASNTRLRSNNIDIKDGVYIKLPKNLKMIAVQYYENDVVKSTPWQFEDFILTSRSNLITTRLFFGYTDDRIFENTNTASLIKMEYFLNAGKKWCALGDSITEGFYSYQDGGSDSIAITPNCWVNICSFIKKLNVTNYGIGGSGFVVDGTQWSKLNAVNLVDTINFKKYDVVTIAYGVNDWKYNKILGNINDEPKSGSIYGNMKYVIEKILSDNSNCKIIIITPLNCCNTTKDFGSFETNWGLGYSLSNSKTLQDVYNAEIEVCNFYGIEYIDLTHYSVVNRLNLLESLLDGVHPSLEIHKMLGHELSNKINFS